jgi:hypothetical protein
MYIKFPTVTKLQYPTELIPEPSLRSTQSFRQNFVLKGQLKLDLIRATESFKIVQLPERGEIMNICMMTVRNKERPGSPSSADKEKEPQGMKRKIASVSKLNTMGKPLTEGGSVNPLKFRSTSIKDIRKFSMAPHISFDYF